MNPYDFILSKKIDFERRYGIPPTILYIDGGSLDELKYCASNYLGLVINSDSLSCLGLQVIEVCTKDKHVNVAIK